MWLERLKKERKLRNPTEDHKIGLTALQNRSRRGIIKFIGIEGKKSLDLLEQALFLESFEEDGKRFYRFTPRGEA